MSLIKIEPITRAEKIQRAIEDEILTGKLLPGARLEEVELAARFEVSRTPVREALRHLASSGLINTKIRQPATVASLGLKQLIEMFEVMSELEAMCARLATRRINKLRLEKLLDCHRQLKKAATKRDIDAFFEVNQKFHEILYRASQNEFLAEQTLSLRNRLRPYRRYVTQRPGQLAATILEHEAVIEAIEQGNEEGAAAAMRSHVNLLGEKLTDFIAVLTPGSHLDNDD
jgi:DNA-binding GntR family transcriptional regulator